MARLTGTAGGLLGLGGFIDGLPERLRLLAQLLHGRLDGADIGAIKSAMEKLGQESQALGQAIYESTQAEQAAGGGEPGPGGAGADDVVDAEVVDDDREGQ